MMDWIALFAIISLVVTPRTLGGLLAQVAHGFVVERARIRGDVK